MATYDLNLNNDYAKEVLSYYIWGQDTQPPINKIADSRWIDRKGTVTLKIDANQFFDKARNIANAKDFKLFEVFFSGKTKNKNELDKNDLNKFKIIDINNEYHLTQE